jgi:hypothetical protein
MGGTDYSETPVESTEVKTTVEPTDAPVEPIDESTDKCCKSCDCESIATKA